MTIFRLLLASDRAVLIRLLNEFGLRAMDYRRTGKSRSRRSSDPLPYVRYERRRGRIVQPVRRVFR